jgi:hypothetical protein
MDKSSWKVLKKEEGEAIIGEEEVGCFSEVSKAIQCFQQVNQSSHERGKKEQEEEERTSERIELAEGFIFLREMSWPMQREIKCDRTDKSELMSSASIIEKGKGSNPLPPKQASILMAYKLIPSSV